MIHLARSYTVGSLCIYPLKQSCEAVVVHSMFYTVMVKRLGHFQDETDINRLKTRTQFCLSVSRSLTSTFSVYLTFFQNEGFMQESVMKMWEGQEEQKEGGSVASS